MGPLSRFIRSFEGTLTVSRGDCLRELVLYRYIFIKRNLVSVLNPKVFTRTIAFITTLTTRFLWLELRLLRLFWFLVVHVHCERRIDWVGFIRARQLSDIWKIVIWFKLRCPWINLFILHVHRYSLVVRNIIYTLSRRRMVRCTLADLLRCKWFKFIIPSDLLDFIVVETELEWMHIYILVALSITKTMWLGHLLLLCFVRCFLLHLQHRLFPFSFLHSYLVFHYFAYRGHLLFPFGLLYFSFTYFLVLLPQKDPGISTILNIFSLLFIQVFHHTEEFGLDFMWLDQFRFDIAEAQWRFHNVLLTVKMRLIYLDLDTDKFLWV